MNKNINYHKGGNNEDLLNYSFIITNLKELLNERPLKYKFDIKANLHYGVSTLDVYVEKTNDESKSYSLDDEPCLSILLYDTKEGVSIGINTLNKCIPINNYGNFMLNSVKEFAKRYGYYSVIIISDGSTLDFKFSENGNIEYIYLDLAMLSILSTGESWYNKMGFYAPISKEQIQNNIYKIHQDIGDIDEPSKIIEFINDTLKRYRNRENKIPKCFKLVSSYGKFRELYNFILNLTKKTETNSIQDVFQEINNIIKTNCDTNTNTCKIDYDAMLRIDCFIMFIYNILDIKYKATFLTYIVNNNVSSRTGGKYLKNRIIRKTKNKLIKKTKRKLIKKTKRNYNKVYN